MKNDYLSAIRQTAPEWMPAMTDQIPYIVVDNQKIAPLVRTTVAGGTDLTFGTPNQRSLTIFTSCKYRQI
jgi:hypothetical protein